MEGAKSHFMLFHLQGPSLRNLRPMPGIQSGNVVLTALFSSVIRQRDASGSSVQKESISVRADFFRRGRLKQPVG